MKEQKKSNDLQEDSISKKRHKKQSETITPNPVFGGVEAETVCTDSGMKYAPETCRSTMRGPSFPVGGISLSTVPVIYLLLQ